MLFYPDGKYGGVPNFHSPQIWPCAFPSVWFIYVFVTAFFRCFWLFCLDPLLFVFALNDLILFRFQIFWLWMKIILETCRSHKIWYPRFHYSFNISKGIYHLFIFKFHIILVCSVKLHYFSFCSNYCYTNMAVAFCGVYKSYLL